MSHFKMIGDGSIGFSKVEGMVNVKITFYLEDNKNDNYIQVVLGEHKCSEAL